MMAVECPKAQTPLAFDAFLSEKLTSKMSASFARGDKHWCSRKMRLQWSCPHRSGAPKIGRR
jgi:hypothetical protein